MQGDQLFPGRGGLGDRVGPHEDKMGMRGSPTRAIPSTTSGCPRPTCIGDEGMGFSIAMHTLDRSRPTIGAQAVGIAQGALDYAIGYMKERNAFGQPIAELQGLQFMVADMAMNNEAARTLTYRACAIIDAAIRRASSTSSGPWPSASPRDTAMEVTTDAVQLLGGYGYTNDFPVERFMRDAKITQIYEGTNQIQRVVIAKKLLG